MKKFIFATISCCLFFVIAGCSNDDEKVEKNKEQSPDEVSVPVNEEDSNTVDESVIEFTPAPSNADDIIARGAGEKMKEIQGQQKELTEEDLASAMEDFPAEKMNADEIVNGIIEWYAMDYSSAHDPLISFEPDYGEYGITKKEKKQLNISVLIDASGSMKANVGGERMMNLAKDAVKRFGEGLPADAIVSLRVYGHKGTGSGADKSMSCASNELFYSPELYEGAKFNEALSKFDAAGWTPLAAAIKAGGEDLQTKASSTTQNMIFVVSDGVETCGGNPVEEAAKLAASDLNVEVNVLGFNVDSEGQKQLKEVAEKGNGKYANVKSKVDFQKNFQSMLAEANAVVHELNQKVANGNDINNRTIQLNDQLLKLSSAFSQLAAEENSNLRMVVNRLRQADRIDNETQFEVNDRLDERRELMEEYGQSIKKEKLELIENTRLEIFDAMNQE